MAYMCLGCYEIYDKEFERCPKVSCYRDVIEVDELMYPAIKMLNQKGYITEFCCSGHVYGYGCNAYVLLDERMTKMFDEDELKYIESILPSSWTMDIDYYGRIQFDHMIKDNDNEDLDVETYEDILKANLEFLHFVQQLPALEY